MLAKVNQMTITKSYSELIRLPTFIERFEYLKLSGRVADQTFGHMRYLNQMLYCSDQWKSLRNQIIIRDNGCDLGMSDREILVRITIHHINPITIDDIVNGNPKVFDPDNLITTSEITHKAIHYGDSNLLIKDPVIRHEYDTCPWKH